jgi:hypothetical protein
MDKNAKTATESADDFDFYLFEQYPRRVFSDKDSTLDAGYLFRCLMVMNRAGKLELGIVSGRRDIAVSGGDLQQILRHCQSGDKLCVSPAIYPLLNELYGQIFFLTCRNMKDFPSFVNDVIDMAAEEFTGNSCDHGALCQNGQTIMRPGPVPLNRGAVRCVCQGLMAIEGITEDFLYTLYHAAALFYRCKPWLHIRLNHAVSFQVPTASGQSSSTVKSRRRYLQVLGGTGLTDVALLLHADWSDVQHEDYVLYTAKPSGELPNMLMVR